MTNLLLTWIRKADIRRCWDIAGDWRIYHIILSSSVPAVIAIAAAMFIIVAMIFPIRSVIVIIEIDPIIFRWIESAVYVAFATAIIC